MARCSSCGTENQDTLKFCGECGTRLEALATPRRDVRKTVTILFTDVIGSTALGEQLDPETQRTVMGRYFAAMKTVIERHGGTVEKFIGDAIMAVFGIPTLHEDDALRAVRAAAEMRDTLEHLNQELEIERGVRIAVRTGVNTGEVVAGDPSAGQTLVTGDAVNTAARLEQAAQPGEILLSEGTARLVRDAVRVEPVSPVDAKGKALPVPAVRLLSVTLGAEAHRRRLDAPLVGREEELERLFGAYRGAVREQACQLFTLLGPAGVGKSRLTGDFVAAVAAEAKVLRGRCLPYGEGITYWPIAEVVRDAAGIDETDTGDEARAKLRALLDGEPEAETIGAQIASAIGLSAESAPQEEIAWAVRRLLEHLARQQPLVVVWDDIHWGESSFLDLIEHIADWSRNAPLLLLCPARPELLDVRPAWGGGKLNATTILLEPLPPEAAARLIDHLPGGSALDAETRRRITDAAEGNPLFVEEMLGMLVDDGYLQQDEGRWQAARDLASVRVPPSIQALLSARLDRLGPDERAVAERAAVVGRVFERSAVAELASEALRPRLTAHLLGLVRKELVRPDAPGLAGDDAFRFRHILIRDAAYDALPKAERAQLHERFADWLERTSGERAIEYQEIIGHHLEQAYLYRRQLAPLDASATELGRRAAGLLADAGKRASDRDDFVSASGLLQRATLLLEPSAERARLLLRLATMLTLQGSIAQAGAANELAHADAIAAGDHPLALRATLSTTHLRIFTNEVSYDAALEAARNAVSEFEARRDDEGLVDAYRLLALVVGMQGHGAEATQYTERRLEAALRLGDAVMTGQAQELMSNLQLYGPVPVADGIRRLEAFQEETHGIKNSLNIRLSLAQLSAMRGAIADARQMASAARSQLEELGLPLEVAYADALTIADIELLADDLLAAERSLRQGYAALDAAGEESVLSTTQGRLAEVLALTAQYDDAERYAHLGRETSAEEDFVSQVYWRRAMARVLASRGDPDGAELMAREALEIAAATDDLTTHADTALTLADILEEAGNLDAAEQHARDALALYEQKGNVVMVERARQRLSEIQGAGQVAPARE